MTNQIRNTYKYWFKVGNLRVHCGITNDLSRREREHQLSEKVTLYNGKKYYWKNGHILKVGNITTRDAALKWEKINNCNANWT